MSNKATGSMETDERRWGGAPQGFSSECADNKPCQEPSLGTRYMHEGRHSYANGYIFLEQIFKTLIPSEGPVHFSSHLLTLHSPHVLPPTPSYQVLTAQLPKSILSPISSSPGSLLHPTLSCCLLSPGPQQPILRLVSQLPPCSLTFTLLHSWPETPSEASHCIQDKISPKPEMPLIIPLSISFEPHSFSVLQPHWPSVCFLNTAKLFPTTQSLDRLIFVEYSFPRHSKTPPFL